MVHEKNFEKICIYAYSPLDSISPSLYIQRPWNARASIGLMESLDRERYLRWQRKPLQRRLRPHQLRRLLRRLLRRNSLRTIACAASDSVAHHSPPLFFSVSSTRHATVSHHASPTARNLEFLPIRFVTPCLCSSVPLRFNTVCLKQREILKR